MLRPEQDGVLGVYGQGWVSVAAAGGPGDMWVEYEAVLTASRMMHVGLGRQHPLRIEYIHIGVCLSLIQDVFTEALMSHPTLPLSRKIALIRALSKLIWIQNDLFAKWYVRDGEEFAEDMENREIEKEGYLHGKKIIRSESSESESGNESTPPSTAATAPSSCPFSGIVKGMAGLEVQESATDQTAKHGDTPAETGSGAKD